MELLRTKRLVLRHWQRDDLAAFHGIYSRWEVVRWLGPMPRTAVADLPQARQRLDRWIEREAVFAPPLGLWAMVEHAGPAPVGTLLLLPLQDSDGPTDEFEIGWHLHPDAQGRGLVTEAAQAVLASAGLKRVLALTDPGNTASQAVTRRLGMTDEGLTARWFGMQARQFAWTGAEARPGVSASGV